MRRDLNGLRVVVTGATSGIGRELAEGLAAGGAEVLAVGRDRERLRQVAGAHPGIRALEGSLETIDQRLALRDAILEAGPVDVLINNAGTQTPVDARAPGPWAVLATEIEVNLSAPIHLSHLLLPALLDRSGRPGDAAIVNVTSGLAMAPKAASAPYCATKAGLRSYTKALRWQLRAEPILIVEALPPIVRTPMTEGRNDGAMSAQACAAEIIDGLTRGRIEIYVGKSKLLKRIMRFSPSMGERAMRGS